MTDLNAFLEWVNQNKNRRVNINLGSGNPSIIVGEWISGKYFCQSVKSVDEIDLAKVVQQEKFEEYKRLKEIFEPLPETDQSTTDDEALQTAEQTIEAHKGESEQLGVAV